MVEMMISYRYYNEYLSDPSIRAAWDKRLDELFKLRTAHWLVEASIGRGSFPPELYRGRVDYEFTRVKRYD